MSENKAYWERHGTKNKSRSRMQEAYSPRPKESVVDVSKTQQLHEIDIEACSHQMHF